MNNTDFIIEKFKTKKATIGILGLGYVGLPLGLTFAKAGFKVLGFDINKDTVGNINSGVCHIKHLKNHFDNISCLGNEFSATANPADMHTVDALIICVPTPLQNKTDPDLSYIIDTIESVLPYMKKGQLMVLESTTYPGTTEEEILPRLEKQGFTVGKDIFLAYSPEREDPGNKTHNTKTIPKVCGGYTEECLQISKAMYEQALDTVVPVSSLKVAEMTKILENVHRAINIGLVNEMKMVADKMDIDIFEVINAAATKPFGFTAYYPGPGLGGHCIPIDPFYLTYKAKQYGVDTKFIELAGEINTNMPRWVVLKLEEALSAVEKDISSSKVLVLGLAYKPDVDDCRETPSAEIMQILKDKGSTVDYSDPHIAKFPEMRNYKFSLSSVDLTAENISNYDAILIATNHSAFDYDFILEKANIIVDTRGVYNKHNNKKIIKA